MKYFYITLLTSLLTACDYYSNDSWRSDWQVLGVGVEVSGGQSDESANSPFDGAFGDGFKYEVSSSKQYWGEDGQAGNQHYTPYSVGSATQYYRGQDENGAYGVGSTGGY